FVTLPVNAVKKRPRRRYHEMEHLYDSLPAFSPVDGTLNHLNEQVPMQRHGLKRNSN
ncbi:hypothetical protein C2E23DRAFT_700378, partial [Lenzites betulinus]